MSKPEPPPADDEQQAFPRSYPGDHGMTLRDYFAGQTLAGLNANPQMTDATADRLAQFAYETADAMLAIRSR